MSLNVAIQMDPIERVRIAGDTGFALMLEAQARGHTLQAGALADVAGQLLADQLAQVLAAVELGFQLQALLQTVLETYRVGQGQGALEQ